MPVDKSVNSYCVEHNIPYPGAYSKEFTKINIDNFIDQWPKEYFDDQPMVNSFGYRSDEFLKNHTGKHILFAGCSFTFGVGLHRKEMWSTKVYDHISKDTPTSGYFNISVFGSSIQHQVINIVKYCKTFGNPDFIFFRMPDLLRGYGAFQNEPYISLYRKIEKSPFPESTEQMLALTVFDYYLMLEQFCNDNGIKLMGFTWHNNKTPHGRSQNASVYVNDILNEKFESFYSDYDFENIIDDELKKNSWIPSKLKYEARDGLHPGIAQNLGYARIAINAYEKIKD
jgi:hypothetical protein